MQTVFPVHTWTKALSSRVARLIIAALLVGCGGTGTEPSSNTPTPAAIAVTAPSLSVQVGKSLQLSAAVTDKTGKTMTGTAVAWSSTPTSVATVGSDGLVTGLSEGTVLVVASSQGVSASVTITVTPLPSNPPASIAKDPAYVAVNYTAGTDIPQQALPRVIVRDANQAPVKGVSVLFRTVSGGGFLTDSVVTTDAEGRARVGSVRLGTNSSIPHLIDASVVGQISISGSPVRFTQLIVTGPAAKMSFLRGQEQSGRPGRPLVNVPVVHVTDQYGNDILGSNPSPGTFSVTGGGTITAPSGRTNSGLNGNIDPGVWTLGPSAGANVLNFTAPGIGSVSITVQAREEDSPFNIAVKPVGLPASLDPIFGDVVHRYRQVIRGSLLSERVTLPSGSCGVSALPAIDTTTSGLIVVVVTGNLGSGVAGSTSICKMRSDGKFPLVAVVTLNSGLTGAIASGAAAATEATYLIAHEFGHALGIGTLWQQFVQVSGTSVVFIGPASVAEYARHAPGCTKIPLRDLGHWSFNLLDGELMTVGTPEWNFSKLSAAAFKDLGYEVDMSHAGEFIFSNYSSTRDLPRC